MHLPLHVEYPSLPTSAIAKLLKYDSVQVRMDHLHVAISQVWYGTAEYLRLPIQSQHHFTQVSGMD